MCATLDGRTVTDVPTDLRVRAMSEWTLRALLVCRFGVVESTFEFRGERLPEVGDEIDLWAKNAEAAVRAKVTGVEPDKSLPVRAAEI
jgi:hypothetical protein